MGVWVHHSKVTFSLWTFAEAVVTSSAVIMSVVARSMMEAEGVNHREQTVDKFRKVSGHKESIQERGHCTLAAAGLSLLEDARLLTQVCVCDGESGGKESG